MIQDSFFSFRYMIFQSKENCLFFSLIVISNEASNLWLICWMCVPLSCTERPTFFLFCSVTAQPQESAEKQHAYSFHWIFSFTFLFLVSWIFHSLGKREGKFSLGFFIQRRPRLGFNVFLSPEPHWGRKDLVWKIFPLIWLYR